MDGDLDFWQERLRSEENQYWRAEDSRARGRLALRGAGTLGMGIAGSCMVSEQAHSAIGTGLRGTLNESALYKTHSMPTLGPPPPCGYRVGEDLGMSEVGSCPPTPVLRRPVKFSADTENRLGCLERTLHGRKSTDAVYKGHGGSSRAASSWGDASSRGLTGFSAATSSRGRLSTAGSLRSFASSNYGNAGVAAPFPPPSSCGWSNDAGSRRSLSSAGRSGRGF
eukprot:TRINITY_DN45656_c0_g1_i1.p1 TRINITY_DN45656_c0_g1~~TRINITY_DN45656_c0_g1_i1.p1  ORF type:complete len:259 (-),score=30.50 TRINITY_DN45656_c0_g1_i1:82-753(-)